MKKLGIALALTLVFAPSALAQQAPSPNANPNATVKTCKNLKAQMGKRNFNATFAPRTWSARAAMRNCARKEGAAMGQARANAAHTCKAWQSDAAAFAAAMVGTPNEGKTFAEVFGTEANAYGKCVSTVARAQNQARRAALVNAAHTCKTWKTDVAAFAAAMVGTPNEGKTFAQVFGTAKNAYGKCVSTVAQANQAETTTP